MSTPTPPATQTPEAKATLVTPATGAWGVVGVLLALIPLVLAIAFFVGAGYLSYQKFGSIGWAILDVLFAYVYYPYYAFFLSGCEPAPVPMMGGMKGLYKMFAGKRR